MSYQPHSPGESATLDILQAYGSLTSSPKSATQGRQPVFTGGETSPASSSSQSDFRLSAISYSSTTNLATLENGTARGEAGDQPFRWNYPSLSELPINPSEPPKEDLPNPRRNKTGGATSIWKGWRTIVFCSCKDDDCFRMRVLTTAGLNLLLFLIPLSWVLSSVMGEHYNLVFIFCILSLIPLVKLHDLGTGELATRVGGAKTGLLNASMSNTVELVVAITALRKCELRVVQASLIGSILSKLSATQIHGSLLNISVGVLLIPAVFHFVLDSDEGSASIAEQRRSILKMSHGVSIVLMFIYVAYLIFQFWSHPHLYKDRKHRSDKLPVKFPMGFRFVSSKRGVEPSKTSPPETGYDGGNDRSTVPSSTVLPRTDTFIEFAPTNTLMRSASEATLTNSLNRNDDIADQSMPSSPTVRIVPQPVHSCTCHSSGAATGSVAGRSEWTLSHRSSSIMTGNSCCPSPQPISATKIPPSADCDTSVMSSEIHREPRLSWTMTLILLTLVTVMVAFTAEILVESMDGISSAISKRWIGLILLPAVSSIAECVTAMNISVRDQLSLSISVTINSTIQTTLFVIPLVVTLGWAIDVPLALLFDPFESVVLYIAG
ncbi:hypothetical protein ID866_7700 [Astraeus odoratus]|nr:hypothetical protein ID866_7700 [Astraeus odoratus]